MAIQNVAGLPRHCFYCWNSPCTVSLHSHSPVGLCKHSTSVSECQWVPLFLFFIDVFRFSIKKINKDPCIVNGWYLMDSKEYVFFIWWKSCKYKTKEGSSSRSSTGVLDKNLWIYSRTNCSSFICFTCSKCVWWLWRKKGFIMHQAVFLPIDLRI